MPAPQSFNKILLTTSNESNKNIILQEISGRVVKQFKIRHKKASHFWEAA